MTSNTNNINPSLTNVFQRPPVFHNAGPEEGQPLHRPRIQTEAAKRRNLERKRTKRKKARDERRALLAALDPATAEILEQLEEDRALHAAQLKEEHARSRRDHEEEKQRMITERERIAARDRANARHFSNIESVNRSLEEREAIFTQIMVQRCCNGSPLMTTTSTTDTIQNNAPDTCRSSSTTNVASPFDNDTPDAVTSGPWPQLSDINTSHPRMVAVDDEDYSATVSASASRAAPQARITRQRAPRQQLKLYRTHVVARGPQSRHFNAVRARQLQKAYQMENKDRVATQQAQDDNTSDSDMDLSDIESVSRSSAAIPEYLSGDWIDPDL